MAEQWDGRQGLDRPFVTCVESSPRPRSMQADRHRGKRYRSGLLDLFLPTNSPGVLHQYFGQGSNRLALFSVLDLIDLVAAGSNRFKVLANRLAMAHRDRFGLQGGFA